MKPCVSLLLFAVLLAGFAWRPAALAAPPKPRDPQTVRDDIYLQEISPQVASQTQLSSVAVLGDEVFVGSSEGLLRLGGDRLAAVPGLSTPIVRLLTIQDAL